MTTSDARSIPEPAVSAGDDPRHFAQVLSAVYDAAMSGSRLPARPRSLITQSWDRVRTAGVNPDSGGAADTLGVAELEAQRRESGLAAVLGELTRGLDAVIADGDNILVVADPRGRVLWRSGSPRVLTRADRLGFVEGADWAESSVGTNAIGTALMSRRPVQVFSAEHFVRTHHSWTCTGAPITDPRTGVLLGVVDVSGPAATVHPTTLALVASVARLAECTLRDQHRRSLDALRSVAAPILARSAGRALAVDEHGWVVAVDGLAPRERVTLPSALRAGRTWLHDLGDCDIEPLPGGWLVQVAPTSAPGSRTIVELDLAATPPTVRVGAGDGSWSWNPTPRHAQILALVARSQSGCSAADLSRHLFGTDDRTVTVRAEVSRLRKRLGGMLVANPYRFADSIEVVFDDSHRTAG
ncbi:GAF domain-containing protein [Gordonia sp. ABSL1-1]|uniref:helix-turn-helix domain-containing protein n=1 Tax=Gordonia sp. ABSL1-1 TaxID=3053923 RepID=UPI002573354D|nr:helix-turn-helix domain-containing protein [Gordonia sp. ABSL1-1]MDL9938793.1 GAF domain-containing protein [Gordonia sp. ABSL1-1]